MKATTVSQIREKEKQTSDREGKLYTLICTLYSMQLRNMAEHKLVPKAIYGTGY